MPPLILVMLGGAIGAGFRYHISRVAMLHLGSGFPWGTWIVNLLGGLLMGVLAGTGVLGGFTTFSAFSLESFRMLQGGEATLAAAYAVSSVAGSVLMLVLGWTFARAGG